MLFPFGKIGLRIADESMRNFFSMQAGGGDSPSIAVEATAEIQWDGVHFDTSVSPGLMPLPDTSKHRIDDCLGCQRPELPWFRAPWRGPEEEIKRMKKKLEGWAGQPK